MSTGFMTGFDPNIVPGLAPNLQWLPMAIIASFIIILLHGFFIGVARAFNMQEFERYSKSEILNAFATLLMVSSFIFLVTAAESFIIDNFIGSQTLDCAGQPFVVGQGAGSGSRLTSALDLLKCRISDKATALATVQEEISEAASVPLNLLNTYISLIGVPVFQGNYVSSWHREVETYRLLNNFITNLLIGMNTLIITTQYIKNNMLTFFLPLGLVLRSVYFTRGIGAFFMAMAIGFYFVFPALYILTDPGFVKPTFSAPAAQAAAPPPLCYPTFSSVTYSIYSSTTAGSPSGGSSTLSLEQLRSDVGSIYASIIIQPFIIFGITIVFIRYLTNILGGESQDILRGVARVI